MITTAIILFAVAILMVVSCVGLSMTAIYVRRNIHLLDEKQQKELEESNAIQNCFRYGAAGCWLSTVFVMGGLACLAIRYFAM